MSAGETVSELLEKADGLAGRNEPSEALALYERALTLDPGNTVALERKVFLLMGQGRRDEALREQDRLVSLEPANPERKIEQANLLLMGGENDRAIACLGDAVGLAPTDHRILQRLALAHRSSGHAERALDVYDRALTIAPEDGDLWAAKADALIDAERPDEAVDALERAARLDPDFADTDWNLRADRYYILADYERAARLYRKAIDVHPNVESWRGLGLTFQATERIEEALECYQEALELEPDNVQLLNDRGFVLLGLRRTRDAETCFRKVVDLAPESLEGWLNLGWTYGELDQPAAAYDAYMHATRLDPDRADTWISVGLCEHQLGEGESGLRKALMSFERAAELDDQSFWAWNNGGWMLTELARYDEAVKMLDRAIDLNPSDVTPWTNKAVLLVKQSGPAAALRCLEEMLDVASDRSAALNAKAQILTEWLGRDEEALELSLQAAGLRPDDESIAANLAEMQLKIGRYPEARETAQRVLDRTDEATNRCAMLFVVWAAHVLEDSESGARARAFAEFVEFLHGHYVAGPGRRVTWSYRGLKRALGERGTSAESRFLLDAAIDVQEGKLRARDMSFFAEHEQLVQLPDA